MARDSARGADDENRNGLLQPASHARRVAAWVVNVLLIVAACVIAGEIWSYLTRGCRGYGCLDPRALAIGLCYTLLPLLILQAGLIARRGYTLGMRVAGLKVFRVDGAPAGFRKGMLLRYLPLILLIGMPLLVGWLADIILDIEVFRDRLFSRSDLLPWLIGIPAVLGPLYILADNLASLAGDGRSLHDRFAGTVVTLAEKRVRAPGTVSNESGSTNTRE